MTHNVYAPPQSNVDASSDSAATPRVDVGLSFNDLAKPDKWRFMWGFFWRSLCVAILSGVGGAVTGGIIGAVTTIVAQLLGKHLADVILLIRILGGIAGLLVGFATLWLFVRWLFRTKWFGYRLRFVKI